MTGTLSARLAGTVAVTLITLVGSATPSIAATPAPDRTIDLAAGLACADFALRVDIFSNPNRMDEKEFTDKNGNVVRKLSAGRGDTLVFTNLENSKQLSLKSNGSVSHTTVNLDGTETVASTGHNVIILFPTDVPAGPSTTLYVGRIVYAVDANEVFTVQSVSGTTVDICAALVA